MRTHSIRLLVAVLSGLLLSSALSCASQPTLPTGVVVGMKMEPREAVRLSVVDANLEDFLNQTLLIEAKVTAVCQSKGCWMQIEDKSSKAMVRWESGCGGQYAFPKNLQGCRVLIQGSIYPKTISEEDAQHLEGEAPPGVRIDRAGYEINASSIMMLADEA